MTYKTLRPLASQTAAVCPANILAISGRAQTQTVYPLHAQGKVDQNGGSSLGRKIAAISVMTK